MRWTMAVALMGGFLTAGTSGADGATARDLAEQAFSETDANKDGQVTHEEYYRRMADMYYHADRDRDGALNRSEVAGIEEEMIFNLADSDDDERLTMPEYIDQRFEHFEEVDGDGNGLLSRDEVIESYEAGYAD